MKERIKLEDIYYFSVKKACHPQLFEMAQKVVLGSKDNKSDSVEIQRRLSLLNAVTEESEHIRQCSNFLAEAITFNMLAESNLAPHWVPETKDPSPDIEYMAGLEHTPVEVKHLNSPRAEHEALSRGQTYGGSINMDYEAGLQKKIEDFVESARTKFTHFNKRVNNMGLDSGALYIFFSKSIDADLTDKIEWQEKMMDRVKKIASSLVGDSIKLVVLDIDSIFS